MNILVTGGAGFIGSHLCERLLLLEHKVICLDNFNNFYSPVTKHNNLSFCIKHPAFHLVEGDIRDDQAVLKCFQYGRIDLVIHLAAMAGVRPSMENPDLYRDVNVNGTSQLLQICQEQKPSKFILASSSSVYGNREGGVFKESDPVEHQVSPYAETKKACEDLCREWCDQTNIPVTVLRFFTCYGPRQRPDLAIHKFTRLMYDNKPITVYGDGSSGRDYTYIDDTVEGIILAMNHTDPNQSYNIYNLGEAQTIKLLDMISELEKASGRKAILEWLPKQPGDVSYTCADLAKSNKVLGYNPKFSFAEGIRRFIAWFEQQE